MEFGILGPVQVWSGEQPVPIPGRREQRVLAALLLRVGRIVQIDYLTEAVWGQVPPATSRAQIHNSIARLRRTIGPETIVSSGGGFALRLGDGTLDAERFAAGVRAADELIDAGREAAAAEELGRALDLWRGAALDGVNSDLLQGEARRWDEQRMVALQRRIDLDLRLGGQRELIGELAALTAEHPLNEQLVGQYMSALYLSGRRADALTAFRQCGERLAADLGMDPGPELSRLHERILRAEPVLADPVSVGGAGATGTATGPNPRLPAERDADRDVRPRQLPPVIRYFTGRTEALRVLDGFLSAPAGTAPALVAIVGSAGVGKTALTVHWAHQISHRFPDGCLYTNLQGFDPSGEPANVRHRLRGFLRALGVEPSRIPAEPAEQIGLYRSLLADRRVLVVLDNARSPEQVRPLIPGNPACLTLVTSRDRLTGLAAVDGAQILPLGLLPDDEAFALLARRISAVPDQTPDAAVRELAALCAGLPLALNVAAARLATDRTLSVAELTARLRDDDDHLSTLETGDPASSVRTVFSASYRALTESAAQLFRRLGPHPGPDFGLAVCVALTGGSPATARRTLDELVGLHLVERHATGRYALHDLVRAFATELCESLDGADGVRDAQRLVLDHYLHTAHGAERLLQPVREPIEPLPARADAVPLVFDDPEAAMAWYRTETPVLLAAAEQALAAGFDHHAWQIPWSMTSFLLRTGAWHDLVETHRGALTALRRLGDGPSQVRCHINFGQALLRLEAFDQAREHFEEALALNELVGDPAMRARGLRSLSALHSKLDQHADALAYVESALEVYRSIGDLNGAAYALNSLAWHHTNLGSHAQAVEYGTEALQALRACGAETGEADTWDTLGLAHHGLGEPAEAERCYRQAIDLYLRAGDRFGYAETLVRLGDVHLGVGAVEQARAAWAEALTVLTELGHSSAEKVRGRLATAGAEAGGH